MNRLKQLAASLTLPRLLRLQLSLISVQFLLGMAVNLIGLPVETNGIAHTATLLALMLHVVVALALLGNSVAMVYLSKPYGPRAYTLAIQGLVGILAAMASGILTLISPLSNVWSYLMAIAFLFISAVYGRLFSVVFLINRKKLRVTENKITEVS